MKTEKIEELFKKYSCKYQLNPEKELSLMPIEEFFFAINRSELEWYKKLEMKLIHLKYSPRHSGEYLNYIEEIQNKIKGLENEN